MNNTNEPICVRHWFESKGKPGAPGTAWQECELCGKTLDQILANYLPKQAVIDALEQVKRKPTNNNIREIRKKVRRIFSGRIHKGHKFTVEVPRNANPKTIVAPYDETVERLVALQNKALDSSLEQLKKELREHVEKYPDADFGEIMEYIVGYQKRPIKL